MDTDGDGVVTRIEFGKAMAAMHKVHKDPKGNMTVPEKAAEPPKPQPVPTGRSKMVRVVRRPRADEATPPWLALCSTIEITTAC